jgi:serine/threonine-protein kinase HipA
VSVGKHSVAVITRFDRVGSDRIPFVSGASLLGLPPGDPGAYTLLADAIRQFGDNVAGDLRELWRRMVFSLLASNYDDHLRNHGFLMRESGRWSLSPAYDVNPVPEIDRARMSKTPISEERQREAVLPGRWRWPGALGSRRPRRRASCREVFTAVAALASDSQEPAFEGRNGGGLRERFRARADGRSAEAAGEVAGRSSVGKLAVGI